MSGENKLVWEHFKLNKNSGKIECKNVITLITVHSYYYGYMKSHLFHKHDTRNDDGMLRWKNINKYNIFQTILQSSLNVRLSYIVR